MDVQSLRPTKDLLKAIDSSLGAVNEVKNLEPLIDRLSRARVVMLGEATHGTAEFYTWRRLITEWLVVKHGFNFIAVEGDWPEIDSVNRYIQDENGGPSAREVLERFHRWPTWMWSNPEIARMAEWLKSHNAVATSKVGFHGMDIYSLFESMQEVVKFLRKSSPFLAKAAQDRYACFDPYHGDELAYARSLLQSPEGCEQEVSQVLSDLIRARMDQSDDPWFSAEQNALIVKNAEKYYRTMVHADESSWNIRDNHMLETINRLLDRYGAESKCIIWAHNTHIGDHRYTDMIAEGLYNIGGLAREKFGEDNVALLGLATYSGTVTASHSWNGPTQTLKLPPAKPFSHEAALHEVSLSHHLNTYYLLFGERERDSVLADPRPQRAVGVVYQPRFERGNYVPTSLARRYDALLYIDQTAALQSFVLPYARGEFPQTWPVGS